MRLICQACVTNFIDIPKYDSDSETLYTICVVRAVRAIHVVCAVCAVHAVRAVHAVCAVRALRAFHAETAVLAVHTTLSLS